MAATLIPIRPRQSRFRLRRNSPTSPEIIPYFVFFFAIMYGNGGAPPRLEYGKLGAKLLSIILYILYLLSIHLSMLYYLLYISNFYLPIPIPLYYKQISQRSAVAQWVECQTANQAARVRIPANINGFFLSVFLAPGGSEPT